MTERTLSAARADISRHLSDELLAALVTLVAILPWCGLLFLLGD